MGMRAVTGAISGKNGEIDRLISPFFPILKLLSLIIGIMAMTMVCQIINLIFIDSTCFNLKGLFQKLNRFNTKEKIVLIIFGRK